MLYTTLSGVDGSKIIYKHVKIITFLCIHVVARQNQIATMSYSTMWRISIPHLDKKNKPHPHPQDGSKVYIEKIPEREHVIFLSSLVGFFRPIPLYVSLVIRICSLFLYASLFLVIFFPCMNTMMTSLRQKERKKSRLSRTT